MVHPIVQQSGSLGFGFDPLSDDLRPRVWPRGDDRPLAASSASVQISLTKLRSILRISKGRRWVTQRRIAVPKSSGDSHTESCSLSRVAMAFSGLSLQWIL